MLLHALTLTAQILTASAYTDLQASVNVDPAQGGTYAVDAPGDVEQAAWGTTTMYGPRGTTTIMPTVGGGAVAYGPNGQTNTYMPTVGGGGMVYGSHGNTSQVMPTVGGGTAIYNSDGSSAQVMPTVGGGAMIYRSDGSSAQIMQTLGGVQVYEN